MSLADKYGGDGGGGGGVGPRESVIFLLPPCRVVGVGEVGKKQKAVGVEMSGSIGAQVGLAWASRAANVERTRRLCGSVGQP